MNQRTDIVFGISADTLKMVRGILEGKAALEDLRDASKALETDLAKAEKSNDNFGFSAARMAKQMDRLRASYDPVYNASKRYEIAVEKVERAHERGAISTAQYQDMLEGLANKYLRVDAAAEQMGVGVNQMGTGANTARSNFQNLGFQIQDFAVQVGSGTSAAQALGQQLPQLASGFGPIGMAIGTFAAVAIPVLVGAFGTAREEADETVNALTRLGDKVTSMQDELTRLKLGIATQEELEAAREIADLIMRQAELSAKAKEATGQAALDYQAQANALQIQIDAERERMALMKTLPAEIERERAKREAVKQLEEASKVVMTEMRGIMQQISMTDLTRPWASLPGFIQAAINKAKEYAQASMQYSGRGGDPREFGANPGTSNTFDTENFTAPAAVTGDGGGGGGANPIQTQLDALRQQLLTEEQLELESFARRQQTLQQALDQRLVTQEEYARLMEDAQDQHQARMADIDVYRYGTALDKASAFLGDMASALQGGNEEMLKISKAFGAAQALISAWQGAAKALELPFPSNLAAFAKVLATGLGAVNAIKGARPGGTTSGGRTTVSPSAATAASAPAAPLDVRLTGISAGDLFSGAQLSSLLDRLSAEAGDRGYRLMVAQ